MRRRQFCQHSWPVFMSRIAILAPIRPRPIMPSCICVLLGANPIILRVRSARRAAHMVLWRRRTPKSRVSLAPCPLEFASVLGVRPIRDLLGPRHPSGRAPPRARRRRSSAAWLRSVRESQTGGRATFVAIRAVAVRTTNSIMTGFVPPWRKSIRFGFPPGTVGRM